MDILDEVFSLEEKGDYLQWCSDNGIDPETLDPAEPRIHLTIPNGEWNLSEALKAFAQSFHEHQIFQSEDREGRM